MNTKLEKQLIDKYPKLFKNGNRPPTESLMCFGCECDDGWYKILDHLFGYLTNLMETELRIPYTQEYRAKHKDDKDYYQKHQSAVIAPPQIILDQVKEKFATLSVYYYTDMEDIPDEIWGILDLNEYYARLKKYNDKIDLAINYAEFQSSVTCEVTGKDGKLYTNGWNRVLCDEEAVKHGYDLADGRVSPPKWVEY
jgi:hypothetical protein